MQRKCNSSKTWMYLKNHLIYNNTKLPEFKSLWMNHKTKKWKNSLEWWSLFFHEQLHNLKGKKKLWGALGNCNEISQQNSSIFSFYAFPSSLHVNSIHFVARCMVHDSKKLFIKQNFSHLFPFRQTSKGWISNRENACNCMHTKNMEKC